MTGAPAEEGNGNDRGEDPADSEPTTVGRRSFVAGAGAGLTLGGLTRAADGDGGLGGLLDTAAEEDSDPHTLATYRALVDACVPRSPELAAERGPEYEAGGLDVGAERFVIWFLNNYYELPPVGGTTVEPPLAPAIASLLDAAATELVARGETTTTPDPARFEGGGPFAALARDDRIAALALLEDKQLDTGRLPGPFQEYEGDAGYVVQGLHAFANGGFYTEWESYGSTRLDAPDEWEIETDVTSWQQTNYPGPSRGHAAHRGYAVQAFRENDWRDEDSADDGGDPPADPPAAPPADRPAESAVEETFGGEF